MKGLPSLNRGLLLVALLASSASGDDATILLADSTMLQEADRVISLLDGIARDTGVFGEVTFEHVPLGLRNIDALASRLRQDPPVRTVIAVVGGISWMDGVNPTLPPRPVRTLIRRNINIGEVKQQITLVQEVCATAGARLLLATAPLSIQARIEMPELLEIERVVKAFAPVFDLAQRFRALQSRPLFADGLDQLDAFGQDELVRAVYDIPLHQPHLLPATEKSEEEARLEARCLRAFAQGDRKTLDRLLPAALHGPPSSPAHANRRAALHLAVRGTKGNVGRWANLEGQGGTMPGLGIGKLLAEMPVGVQGQNHSDPLERGLEALLRQLNDSEEDPDGQKILLFAEELARRFPHRLESWVAFSVVGRLVVPPVIVQGDALRQLKRYDTIKAPPSFLGPLLRGGTKALNALPALVAASCPEVGMTPSGPLLDKARRRAALGKPGAAALVMENARSDQNWLPAWETLVATWNTEAGRP